MIENWRQHYNKVRPHSSFGVPTASTRGSCLAGKTHGANASSKLTFQTDHWRGPVSVSERLDRGSVRDTRSR